MDESPNSRILSLLVLAIDSADTHPTLAPAVGWPGVMIIVIVLGFILTAAILGPIVRAIMREEKSGAAKDNDPKADI